MVRFIQNTNTKLCSDGYTEDGTCCCNCKHHYGMYSDTYGYIGSVCKLDWGETEGVHLTYIRHGLCELYEKVD